MTIAAVLFALGSVPAVAEDSCKAFSWPMEREAALFSDATTPVANGTALTAVPKTAVRLSLVAQKDAAFPTAPQREAKKPEAKGGWLTIAAPESAGVYQITLSTRGWIDTIQAGKALEHAGFTSDENCAVMHKSVRFTLAAEPVTIQVSDVAESEVVLTILPATQ
jgi:hypothetical protein